MCSPVRCHFEIYASVDGSAKIVKTVVKRVEPVFRASAGCFDLDVVFYDKVDGRYWVSKEVDWDDTIERHYAFQTVYDGKVKYDRKAKIILRALDELRKCHGFYWHERQIELIQNGPTLN